MGAQGEDKEKSPFIDQIQGLFNGLEVMNIHYQHNAQPLSLMEHPHQTKVVLFESLKVNRYSKPLFNLSLSRMT
jgi:ATP-dependent helicase/nuclease subunit B